MGIHQCPLIFRSYKWLDISTSIHTSQDVLGYLGTHWHQWWVCLALVNDIHQWSVIQWLIFMLDIDTFIRMTRIVPSSFTAGEDYTLFHDSISSCSSTFPATWEYHSNTFILPLFHDSSTIVQIPPLTQKVDELCNRNVVVAAAGSGKHDWCCSWNGCNC